MVDRFRTTVSFSLSVAWLGVILLGCGTSSAERDHGDAAPGSEQTGSQVAPVAFADYPLVCRGAASVPSVVLGFYCDFGAHPGGCNGATITPKLDFLAGTENISFPVSSAVDSGVWRPGECRWWDRAFRPGEATSLSFIHTVPDAIVALYQNETADANIQTASDQFASFAVHAETRPIGGGATQTFLVVDGTLCSSSSAAPQARGSIDEGLCTDYEAHNLFVQGAPLSASASPCAAAVCAQDPNCCSTQWDGTCVLQASIDGCVSHGH